VHEETPGEMGLKGQNEKRFGQWVVLPDGGRRYWRDIFGHTGGRARYCKVVGPMEDTRRFWQEIYDVGGNLVQIHEKFPVDKGHQRI
jgi:hypothetical protein